MSKPMTPAQVAKMPSDLRMLRKLATKSNLAAARTSAEYVQKVLEAVGLAAGCETQGYRHLSPVEIAALREVVARKAAAFGAKDSPPLCYAGLPL